MPTMTTATALLEAGASIDRPTTKRWDPNDDSQPRGTTPQVELTGAARRDNLRGAFRVPDRLHARVAGRRIDGDGDRFDFVGRGGQGNRSAGGGFFWGGSGSRIRASAKG